MSVTASTALQEISKRAQEFLMGTTNANASLTTFIDTNNLTHADDYWDEASVYFSSGSNNGLERRVSGFAAATGKATMYSAVTASVPSGVTYELARRFNRTDVFTALNRSLNVAAPDFREKVRAVATAVADTLQYAFPTSPDLSNKGLVAIEYQQYTNPNQTDWPYTKLSTDLYEVIEDFDGTTNVKTLQLKFNPETNKLIRFVFDGALGNVTTGTDVIHLDLPEMEWVYTQSVAELWRIESSRTVDANRKAAIDELARWESSADRLRRQLGQEKKPRPLFRTHFRVI